MTQDRKPPIMAQDYFTQGFACAPSVLMAFAEQFALPVETAARVAAAHGAGICRSGQLCGAVSGALMVIGLHAGSATPKNPEARDRTYALGQRVMADFAARHGSILCPNLLDGCQIGNPEESQYAREHGFFDTRCPIFVYDAAEIAERILKE